MKTQTSTLIATIIIVLILMVHAAVTPIVITNRLNSKHIDYTTHYAKGDSIDYEFINLINSEIYEAE